MRASCLLLLLAFPMVWAQSPARSAPDARPLTSQAAQTARQGDPQQFDAVLQRAAQQARAAAGTPLAAPVPPGQIGQAQPIDPAQVAAQYEQLKRGLQAGPNPDEISPIMVFVSSSMPKASLERIAQEARRIHAPMILRGVRPTDPDKPLAMLDMQRQMLPYTQAGAQVLIHPILFKRFDVRRVPAVVVAGSPVPGCDAEADLCTPAAEVIYGDVSLAFALERIESKRKDEVGRLAAAARATLVGERR